MLFMYSTPGLASATDVVVLCRFSPAYRPPIARLSRQPIDILPRMTAVGADATQPSELDEHEFAVLRDEIRAYVDDAGARWADLIER